MRLCLNMSFFLSAKHWVTINGAKGPLHTHIWEIILQISGDATVNSHMEIGFSEIESVIKAYLSYFEGKVFNQVRPFDRFNPSTENLGIFLSSGIKTLLAEKSIILEQLTIRESPTRGVTIGELDNGLGNELLNSLNGEIYPEILPTVDADGERQLLHAGGIAVVEKETTATEETTAAEKEIAATSALTVDWQTGVSGQAEPGTGWAIIGGLAGLFVFNLLLYSPVLFARLPFPWGSDAWAHLYKAEFLYDSIRSGNFFPRYMPAWDNGVDPFRYWAPLSYYMLVLLKSLTGDIYRAFNIFMFAASLAGSSFWLLFARRLNVITTFILAVLWSVAPYNLAMTFASGNTPWVMAFVFFPPLLFLITEVQYNKEKKAIYEVAVIAAVNLMILSHAMVAALVLVGLTVFLFFTLIFGGTNFKRFMRTMVLLALSVVISGWWILPSQVGGAALLNKEAVREALNYFSLTKTLNPLARLNAPEDLYLGLGYVIAAVVQFTQWRTRTAYQKAGIVSGLAIFVLTTPFVKPLYGKLPMSQLLWPERFVPIGIALLLLGIVEFKPDLKSVSGKTRLTGLVVPLLLVAVIFADSLVSFNLIRTREFPTSLDNIMRSTVSTKGYKVAVLDLSRQGSVPSFIVSQKYQREQVFGAAWQGAHTSNNLMMLNTALEKGWYNFLFDRLIEMGATHLIVQDDVLKEQVDFGETAAKFGFVCRGTDNGISAYVKESGPYLVTADYQILGIGKHAANLAVVFPEIRLGAYTQLDRYSPEELSRYKVLYLSGFDWVSKKKAEDLILDYAQNGGRVVVDLTGAPQDVLSNRVSFLGVVAEPVIFEGSPLITAGSKDFRLANLPEDKLPWKTFVLEGVDQASSLVDYYDKKRPIEGYKVFKDRNIYFVGLNLPYYGFLTKDANVLHMLSDLMQTTVNKTVDRDLVEFSRRDFDFRTESIEFRLPERLAGRSLVIPEAYLDSMQIQVQGPPGAHVASIQNLIELRGQEGGYKLLLTNHWPAETRTGAAFSAAGVILTILLIGGTHFMKFGKKFVRTTGLLFLLIMAIAPGVSAAEKIVLDGTFNEWETHTYIDDPPGDIMDVSDQTETSGDTRRLYWGTNDGDPSLYFSVARYPSNVKDDQKQKMTGKIFFDINNNGNYEDSVDKVGFFRYDPGAGKVAVKLYRAETQNDSPSWHTIGNWGERNKGQAEGVQFEFSFPFEEMGITANQPIRFYATTSFIKNDNPKSDDDWVRDPGFNDNELFKHDFDLIPSEGDIQYSPIPVLGYGLLAAFLLLGIAGGVQIIRRKRTDTDGQVS